MEAQRDAHQAGQKQKPGANSPGQVIKGFGMEKKVLQSDENDLNHLIPPAAIWSSCIRLVMHSMYAWSIFMRWDAHALVTHDGSTGSVRGGGIGHATV